MLHCANAQHYYLLLGHCATDVFLCAISFVYEEEEDDEDNGEHDCEDWMQLGNK